MQSRFDDFDMMFPNVHHLHHVYTESYKPHVFNFFSLHGKQVFIQLYRNRYYRVFSRFVKLGKCKRIELRSAGYEDYIYLETNDIVDACRCFSSKCDDLIHSVHNYYYETNPLL